MNKRRGLLGLMLMALLLISTSVASAQSSSQKSLYWDRFDVLLDTQQNGDIHVVETQAIVFTSGSFHFGNAVIPIKNQQTGLPVLDQITNFSVTEGGQNYRQVSPTASGESAPGTFFVERNNNGDYSVTWFFAPTANQGRTFQLGYTVKGAIRVYPDGDQIDWFAVPADHQWPVRSSTVTVRLPNNIPIQIAQSYGIDTQPSGVGESQVIFQAPNGVPAGQDFEVRVQFPHGALAIAKPDWQAAFDQQRAWNEGGRQIANLILGALGLLVLIGGPLGIYLLWMTKGRDPQVGLVAEYVSEPPSDLPSGLVGALVDEQVDMPDILSTLVDLARRGYLTMEEQQSAGFMGIGKHVEFVYHRTDKPANDLRPYEQTFLQALFGGRESVTLSELRDKFYVNLPTLRSQIYDQLVKEGFFPRNPNSTRNLYTGLGIFILIVAILGMIVVGAAFASSFAEAVICPFAALAVTGIALAIVGRAMPAKTRAGAEAAARWRAFKRYLQNVEKYTQLKEATDQFERYLPYAIAFGLERSWVNKFAQLEREAVPVPIPIWYRPWGWGGYYGSPMAAAGRGAMPGGGLQTAKPGMSLEGASQGMFSGLNAMSTGLFSMLNTTASVFTSQPQPQSRGGGWGGGGRGWSGGGFGGGGGGGGGSRGFG